MTVYLYDWELTFCRDRLSFARTDSDGASLGQISSCPPHFDLHMSITLIHMILYLSEVKHWSWRAKEANSKNNYLFT